MEKLEDGIMFSENEKMKDQPMFPHFQSFK